MSDKPKVRVYWEPHHNFGQQRGCNFEVLPFLRIFPPTAVYRETSLTVHFGWMFWTVIVRVYKRADELLTLTPRS